MDGYTYNFGGLDPSGELSRNLRLKIITEMGAIGIIRRAIDTAVETRRGLVIQGIKGCGKSLAIREATKWFAEKQKRELQADSSHRIRRVEVVGTLRDAGYRETGFLLAKTLQGHFRDRVHNRKMEANEIREELVKILLAQGVAGLVLDEAERCSDETLLFMRDLMADVEAADSSAHKEAGAVGAGGVGIVLVGDTSIGKRVLATNEAGQRWTTIEEVPPLSLDQAVLVYGTWLPGLKAHAAAMGSEAWKNYLGSLICRGQPISFRTIENHVRTYVHLVSRIVDGVDTTESVPFIQDLFEVAALGGLQ